MLRILISALILAAGCSNSSNESAVANKQASGDAKSEPQRSKPGAAVGRKAGLPEAARKIIFTANIELAVEDFSNKPDEVKELVMKYGGFVAGSTLSAESGSDRNGQWKVRIPTEHFDAFLDEAISLGEIIRYVTSSQEITDQYYDTQSRTKNKEIERDRMQSLLNDKVRVANLKNVMEVERELSRVQGEIERFQGQTRRWDDLTSLTTINLNIRQIRNYVPQEAAGFGTLARRTFLDSWEALKHAGQAVALVAIALAPWLPLIVIGIFILRFGWKRLWLATHSP